MNTLNINLPLENMLRDQLFKALHGNIIENIIKEAKVGKFENQWRYLLQGHSLKLEEKISGRLYNIFSEVKQKLAGNMPVEFYISSSSDINAFAILGIEDNDPSIININSGLLQLMNDEELKFVIGHEIGHLLSKNTELVRIKNFVFPDPLTMPQLMQNKMRLWNQLSELTADRYGYIACPDLKTCISAFFKMSSGLDAARIDLDIDGFIEENEKRLEFFKKDEGLNVASHPINPIRIKALELFSQSELYKNLSQNNDITEDSKLADEIDELTSILLKIKNSEIDLHITYFIASAGLIVSCIDKNIEETEYENIKSYLSEFMIFPDKFIENMIKNEKVEDVFECSYKNIMNINPGYRENMLYFIASMIISDRKIAQKEVEMLFHFGVEYFKYSRKEVAQLFGEYIQNKFMPAGSMM